MKTERHPYSRVIHYSAGGSIWRNKDGSTSAEWRTLCKRKFKQGHSALMMDGAYGAERVTCKSCRAVLNQYDVEREARAKVERWLREGKSLKVVKAVGRKKI